MLTNPSGRVHTDVLVIGAGYVGEVAARLFAAEGRHVTAVRRTPPDRPDGVHWLAADVASDEGLARLPTVADVVVFTLSPGGRDAAAYRRAHCDIPAAVVRHLASGPERVVMTTSTGVYGQDDGSLVDEASPTDPERATAGIMVEGETALRRLAPLATSLRLGGIYGPGRTRLVDQVRHGEATWAPGQWTNRIHRDDAATAITHVLTLDAPPPVANVVDDTPAERRDVLQWLAALLHAPSPREVDPGHQDARRRGTSKRVDNRLLRSTGWAPTMPSWREGYVAMLDEPA